LSYTFRLRFIRSPHDTLSIQANSLTLPLGDTGKQALLQSLNKESPIQDSTQLVLRSDGWNSKEEADCAGKNTEDALMVTLTRLRVGADFGIRAPKSFFTQEGLVWLEQTTGSRVLNDVHGLMVFPTIPSLRLASGNAGFVRGVAGEQFEKTFEAAVARKWSIAEKERTAFMLFHASLFQAHADARFLMLVMAIEALLDPQPRPKNARVHVDTLLSLTLESSNLSNEERQSLLSSLRWLQKESINQAGRRLVSERLGARLYLDQSAPKFFSSCYSLRSRLAHGVMPFPTREEVDSFAATLEVFVSDLLSTPLLGVSI
jgi:hypothetical protein